MVQYANALTIPLTLLTKGLMFAALCGFLSAAHALPKQATENDVKSCQFIRWVVGESGYENRADWRDLAKLSVISHAERLGASDIVWGKFTQTGLANGVVNAKTYACGNHLASLTHHP